MNVNKFLIHTTVFKRDMEMYGRAGDWVGYPIYYCKTQSLGGSFTMHDPNLWAQLNYASTQTQWGWVH